MSKQKYKRKAHTKKWKGRPPKFYHPKFNEVAYVVCARFGAKTEELCELFGISDRTLYEWKKRYDDFARAIQKGKDEYDTREIEDSLRNRAKGYEFTETHIERTRVRLRRHGKFKWVPGEKVKTITKHIPSDPSSMFFWLTNRNRERWQNLRYVKKEVKSDIKEQKSLKVTLEQLQKLEVHELEALLNAAARLQPNELIDVAPNSGDDQDSSGMDDTEDSM